MCLGDDDLDLGEQSLQPVALLVESQVEGGEGLLLALLERFELREGQPPRQFGVGLDFAAEEVAGSNGQQRLPLTGLEGKQMGKVAILGLLKFEGNAVEKLVLGGEQGTRVDEARE